MNLDKLIFYGSLNKAQEVKEKLEKFDKNFAVKLSNEKGNLIARYVPNGGLAIYPEEGLDSIEILSLPKKASDIVVGRDKEVTKFKYNGEMYYFYVNRDAFQEAL